MSDAGELPNPLLNEFWVRPENQVNHDLELLRQAGGLSFHSEPPVPDDYPLPQGPGSWVTINYADILHVSKNADIFSSASGITVQDMPMEFVEYFSSMIAMDDPRHARLRRLVSAGFTPRMLNRLRDTVQHVAGMIIDEIVDKDEIDFVTDVAAALPLKIVCDLMGIPESHYEFVFDRTNIILGAGDPEYVADTGDILTAILTAGMELAELMNEVAEQKRGGDGSDLTSTLINAELEDDQLSPSDLASFFILLVVAGNETTRNSMSWGLKFLTDNPEQQAMWKNDFDALATQAVDEIVRLASPVTYMRRTVTEATAIRDVQMDEGTKICLMYLGANRDPQMYSRPQEFDIRRENQNHVGFGGPGPHFCLGAHLARMQITEMYRQLFDRVPNIRAVGEPDLLHSAFIHGIKHLTASVNG